MKKSPYFKTNVAATIVGLGLACLSWCLPAHANTSYPERNITFVTIFAPGNAPDIVVRAIASEISQATGQGVAVDGRVGAGGVLAPQVVSKASPDGYTVLVTSHTPLTANRHLLQKLAYDPVNDFDTVASVGRIPVALFVNTNKIKVESVEELVELAKKNPKQYTYGMATPGTRVLGAMLQAQTGIELEGVPYRSTTQAIPDLQAGNIDMLFTDLTATKILANGPVKALAIASNDRSSLAPDLPTFAELEIDNMALPSVLLAAVPKGTPPEVITKLNRLLMDASQAPKVQAAFKQAGMDSYELGPKETRDFLEQDAEEWKKYIEIANIPIQ